MNFWNLCLGLCSNIALLCFALHFIALLCYALLCIAWHCFALLCYALLCFAFHCFALLCFALELWNFGGFGNAGNAKELCAIWKLLETLGKLLETFCIFGNAGNATDFFAMFLGCGEPGQEGSGNPAGEGSPGNRAGAETRSQSLMLWKQ